MKYPIYLIPTQIAPGDVSETLPPYNTQIINQIKHFIVENERTARRQLIVMGIETAIDELRFYTLNKHTSIEEMTSFLNKINEGPIGLLSEAGLPAIADPGSEIVKLAHQKGIRVIPLVGPSSLFLALMASGMNGQQFCFHGYLPVKKPDLAKTLKELERKANLQNETQIFIEAPYRNNQLLQQLVSICLPTTRICIAANIASADEMIQTKTAAQWSKSMPNLHKQPVVFLMGQ